MDTVPLGKRHVSEDLRLINKQVGQGDRERETGRERDRERERQGERDTSRIGVVGAAPAEGVTEEVGLR